jgi:hypothetical protein
MGFVAEIGTAEKGPTMFLFVLSKHCGMQEPATLLIYPI